MIDGTYSCMMTQTIGGMPVRRYGEMELRVDGNELKGKMFPTMFWLNSPFRCGTVEGNRFSFTVHFATPCQQFSMSVEGEVQGNEVTADVSTDMGVYKLTGTRIL